MSTTTYCEKERQRLEKILNFRLPHHFKKIGIGLFLFTFILMIVFNIILDTHSELIRNAFRYALIIGMLFVSLARDKEEDEMTAQLRAQSYSMAFVIGVLYALFQPIVDYLIEIAIHPNGDNSFEVSAFQILIFMLFIQIAIYHQLKKMR